MIRFIITRILKPTPEIEENNTSVVADIKANENVTSAPLKENEVKNIKQIELTEPIEPIAIVNTVNTVKEIKPIERQDITNPKPQQDKQGSPKNMDKLGTKIKSRPRPVDSPEQKKVAAVNNNYKEQLTPIPEPVKIPRKSSLENEKIKAKKLESVPSDFVLLFLFDSIVITYDYADNFGIKLNPFIEFHIDNKNIIKIPQSGDKSNEKIILNDSFQSFSNSNKKGKLGNSNNVSFELLQSSQNNSINYSVYDDIDEAGSNHIRQFHFKSVININMLNISNITLFPIYTW